MVLIPIPRELVPIWRRRREKLGSALRFGFFVEQGFTRIRTDVCGGFDSTLLRPEDHFPALSQLGENFSAQNSFVKFSRHVKFAFQIWPRAGRAVM